MKIMIAHTDSSVITSIKEMCDQQDAELVAICNDLDTAVKALIDHQPDLVLLDAELEGGGAAKLVSSVEVKPMVVVVSAHNRYAVEAFDIQAIDFVKTPLTTTQLTRACHRASELLQLKKDRLEGVSSIFIKEDNMYTSIPFDKVKWIEALGDYVTIQTDDAKHTVLATMKAIENKLPRAIFQRVHRSYIANVSRITRINTSQLYIGEKALPLGPSYKKVLMNDLYII